MMFASLFLGLSVALSPHDPGLSSIRLRTTAGTVVVHAAFANADFAGATGIATAADGVVRGNDLAASPSPWRQLVAGGFLLQLDGQSRTPQLRDAVLGENGDVELTFVFADARGDLRLEVDFLQRMAHGHRSYAALLDDGDHVLADALLSPRATTFVVDAEALGRTPGGFAQSWQFFGLGVEHILLGFDHLAFLLVLLAAGVTWRRAVATISAFTIAHSMTLAIAVFGWVHLPSRLVEASIAASIVVVAAANLVQRARTVPHRWQYAFGFGLLHGFGFASVLGDFGVGGTDMWLPLVTFNLGVEIGQLAFAAIAAPLLFVLARRQAWRHAPLVVSIGVGAAGVYWCCERLLG